jgi:hypothetical protein
MNYFFYINLVLFSFASYAQTDKDIDGLCDAICVSIQESTASSDQEKVSGAFEDNIIPFIELHDLTVVDDLLDKVYYRLQKRCPLFLDILNAATQSLENGDWEIIEKSPEIKLTKKEARLIAKKKVLYYYEADRKKTYVTIKGGKWIETFSDGTTSTLKFKWTGDSTFDLVFIESNNETRKNFSNAGDVYSYTLVSDEDGFFYFISHLMEGDNRLLLSKFHYQ